jgi:glycosyltransferase involved in cell wall biosynthesis
MKILQIHKYYSKKRGGGSVSAFFETKKLLEKRGHEVMIFSMQDDDNEFAKESKYFADHFDIRSTKNIFQKMWLIPRIIYNRNAAKNLNKLLQDKKPDVAHVHNIYHYLTPSIFKVLKKNNIPIVFKLSDYHVICPNYKLFAHGQIDNSCKQKKYYKLFFNRSINDSYLESFVAMLEGYVNKWYKFYDYVDAFAAPSNFMKELCVEYGLPRKKINILRNVINFEEYSVTNIQKEKYFLYMGRISEEKGLKVAIDAIAKIKNNNKLNNWKFIIAGKGPYEKTLCKYVKSKKLEKNIRFVGFYEKGSVEWVHVMSKASVAVLPSIWYDNSPIAISESMVFKTPVIVSDYGGTKEMIKDGESGFVFKTGESIDLAQKMQIFIDNEELVETLGTCAFKYVMDLNSEEKYYNKLMQIYKSIIDK